MEISKRIKEARDLQNISLSELSKRTKIAKSTLQRYETGTTKKIPMSAIAALEQALNLDAGYLMGWIGKPQEDLSKYGIQPIKLKKFRMIGEIACGQPIYANEEYETFIEASSDINADFCLTAKGDSMINARIFDGDVVFIRAQNTVENGEIAAVVIGDTATLKRVFVYKNRIELRAENPTHDPIDIEGADMENVRILGKAVAFQSYVK